MALVEVTNVTSESLYITEAYVEVRPGRTIQFFRTPAQVIASRNLQTLTGEGKIATTVTLSVNEVTSDLVIATPTYAGLMGASDKAKLDSITVVGTVFIDVRNESGAPIAGNMLVYSTGFNTVENRILIGLADKDDSSKTPAIGFTLGTIANNANGQLVIQGLITGLDTSLLAQSDQLVLGNLGGFIVSPGGSGEAQNVGSVVRVHATDGMILAALDGVLPAHAYTHRPTGVDPLAVGLPVDLSDSTNSIGTSDDYALGNHIHAHGNRGGGSLHAVATAIVAGFMSSSDKSKLDALASEAAPSTFMWGAGSVGTTTTTRYLFPGFEGTAAQTTPIIFRIPRGGKIRKMRVHHNTPAGNGNPIVYTLRVEGVATALTVSLASTASEGFDNANSVTVLDDDQIDIEVTKGAGIAASPTDVTVSVEFSA